MLLSLFTKNILIKLVVGYRLTIFSFCEGKLNVFIIKICQMILHISSDINIKIYNNT